ncbi:MAG: hypothetical protein ACREEL_05625 [Stellaceae bacterium]
MRRVNDRNFLNRWQILHQASCPGLHATSWRVGDVAWRKNRLSFTGPDCAVTLELHHLDRTSARWALLVVVEHWWDGKNEPIKATTWARVLTGSPKAVIAWLRAQGTDESVGATHAEH